MHAYTYKRTHIHSQCPCIVSCCSIHCVSLNGNKTIFMFIIHCQLFGESLVWHHNIIIEVLCRLHGHEYQMFVCIPVCICMCLCVCMFLYGTCMGFLSPCVGIISTCYVDVFLFFFFFHVSKVFEAEVFMSPIWGVVNILDVLPMIPSVAEKSSFEMAHLLLKLHHLRT